MIRLQNTLGRKHTELQPDHQILIYTCGPTVYMSPHIGNWRTFIFYDTLVRTLKAAGYKTRHVINITDVGHLVSDADSGDDKLQKQAAKERTTAWDIAQKYTAQFLDGWEKLNCLKPSVFAKATDYIDQQIEMVKLLEEKGFTYVIDDGVYFDTSKDPKYGELANLDIEGQDSGARVTVNDQKRQPQDFALWKFSPNNAKRDMEWDSPWGKGFPGWHLECSAIAKSELADTIDIHAGGIDHIPVHHTNEIAQSENANGVRFANIWLHAEFMKVDGKRMGKSEGNFYTLEDLSDKQFSALDFRMFALQAHYRTETNFTWENLLGAKHRLANIYASAEMRWQSTRTAERYDFSQAMRQIMTAMEDDIDTPKALQVVSAVVKQSENGVHPDDMSVLIDFWNLADNLLGLKVIDSTPDIKPKIKQMIDDRAKARSSKDYQLSDKLRDELKQEGIQINDSEDQQYWSRARQ